MSTVELPVTGDTKAVQYTLTSSDHTKAPKGWVLQGSADGERWTDLDKRTDESFRWDRQLRAFSIDAPKAYGHYRLVLTGEAALTEVELLS